MRVAVQFKEDSTRYDVNFGEITVIMPEDTEEMQAQVEQIRNAILWRGGEISTTAGLDEVPEAIMNIPADASLAFQTDDSVAYQKIVPSGAEEYAQVAKVGGMTYKTRNLIPFPYRRPIGYTTTVNGVTFTVQSDGGVSVVGTATQDISFQLHGGTDSATQQYFSSVFKSGNTYAVSGGKGNAVIVARTMLEDGTSTKYWIESNANKNGSGVFPEGRILQFIAVSVTGGNTVNEVVYPMLNEGSTALPYEPYYEGLRDTKVTELVSEGANLLPRADMNTSTKKGITGTVNLDGSITLSGIATETGNAVFYIYNANKNIDVPSGTYTLPAIEGASHTTYYFDHYFISESGAKNNYRRLNNPITITLTERQTEVNAAIVYVISQIGEVVNKTFYPMLNRGTSPVPYKPYRGTLDTFPISAELRAFLADKGYGRGVSGYPNYIDFERKVFVQNTYRQVFNGAEAWRQRSVSSTLGSDSVRFSIDINNKAIENTVNTIIPSISTHFTAISSNDTYSGKVGFGVWYNATYDYTEVFIFDDNYKTLVEWKAHLAELYASGNPLIIEYAMAEPIETDISAYLDDDIFIAVEDGGTITAVNEYEQPAPSTLKYTVKIGG